MEHVLYDLRGKRIYVAGHKGMVGSALMRRLANEGCELITADRSTVNLISQQEVNTFFSSVKPHAIFMAAAKVGGILANATYPSDFLYQNVMIAANITQAAFENGIEKMVFLGSSCIYPKMSPQPIEENALLTGPLETTNEWYAIAKITGLKLAEAYRRQFGCDYISAMPTNLYGPGDNFDLASSHVLPALIRKAHEAKLLGHRSLQVWGTGAPRREFLHSDDCADALVHIMKFYSDPEPINVGYGSDISIKELTELISEIVGFKGSLDFDITKPDGTPRKLMSNKKLIDLGWLPRISLRDGIERTYLYYLDTLKS